MTDTIPEDQILPPTKPGFYAYDCVRQTMLFLLDGEGQWYTIFDNGNMDKCEWGYIDQALSVYNLVRIDEVIKEKVSLLHYEIGKIDV